MAYQSWSVVFGEQPSAAKWNILGTNDSYFNSTIGTLASFYWNGGSGTWTYASSTTFTVPSADAACMAVGTKIWLTQTTSKYFYVTGISGTTITVTGGSDYTVANAAITAPYYSNAQTPVGFPQYFNYTPTFANTTTGAAVIAGRFNMVGRMVNFRVSWVFGAGSAMGTSPTATLPITATTTQLTNANAPIGTGTVLDYAVANYFIYLRIESSTTVGFIQPLASGTYTQATSISATVPITWAASDALYGEGHYEAA